MSEDRRALLNAFDKLHLDVEAMEPIKNADDAQDQAYELLLGGRIAGALDLTKEDRQVLAAYDTARYVRPDGWRVGTLRRLKALMAAISMIRPARARSS